MAWIRIERQVNSYGGAQQYEAICEEDDDLTADATNGYASYDGSHIEMAVGSLALCIEDGKLYVKKSDGNWAEVG